MALLLHSFTVKILSSRMKKKYFLFQGVDSQLLLVALERRTFVWRKVFRYIFLWQIIMQIVAAVAFSQSHFFCHKSPQHCCNVESKRENLWRFVAQFSHQKAFYLNSHKLNLNCCRELVVASLKGLLLSCKRKSSIVRSSLCLWDGLKMYYENY